MTARLTTWLLLGLTVSATLLFGASPALASHYRVEALEIFDEAELTALTTAGIVTTEDYLRATLTSAERQALSTRTGISELEILVFARLSELLQIEGVGPRAAQLLRASGVVSAADLAEREPAELVDQLVAVNAVEQFTGVNPTVENLEAWIEGAQGVPYHLQ